MRTREKKRILRLFMNGLPIGAILVRIWPSFYGRYVDRDDVEAVIREEMRKRRRDL